MHFFVERMDFMQGVRMYYSSYGCNRQESSFVRLARTAKSSPLPEWLRIDGWMDWMVVLVAMCV